MTEQEKTNHEEMNQENEQQANTDEKETVKEEKPEQESADRNDGAHVSDDRENTLDEKEQADADTALTQKIAEQAAEIEKLKKDADDFKNRWLRAQADFDNFRKRANKEKADGRKFRAQDLVTDLLDILDNFQRALAVDTTSEDGQAMKKGMEMVLSKLDAALKKEGVAEIPALNQPFDPHVHQAVMQEESEAHEPGTVIQVLQPGYMLNGRVLRPAMVKVSS